MRTLSLSSLIALAVTGVLMGCAVPNNATSLREMGTEGPWDLAGLDLSIGPGSIGAACTANADCTSGTTPSCWQANVLDSPGNLPTPGGYCTSICTSDADCGGTGTCQVVSAGVSKYCLRTCLVADTCRSSQGYACFILTQHTGYCYPATRLSCNPTQVDPATKNGTCPGASPVSACIRRAFEDLGECRPICNFGVATCAAASGQQQHCVYLDTTKDKTGTPTRDAFKGLSCFPVYSDAKRDGESCTYFDECVDGYQCNLVPGGDSKCHQLCQVGVSGACPDTQSCHDSFGAGLGQPGLCTQ